MASRKNSRPKRSPKKQTPVRSRAAARKPAVKRRSVSAKPVAPAVVPSPVPALQSDQAPAPNSLFDRKVTWTTVAFLATLVAAEAIHWFLTPMAHPDADIVERWLIALQAILGLVLLGWAVVRYRRAR